MAGGLMINILWWSMVVNEGQSAEHPCQWDGKTTLGANLSQSENSLPAPAGIRTQVAWSKCKHSTTSL